MTPHEISLMVAEVSQALNAPIQWVEDRISMKENGAVAYSGRQIQNDGGGWQFVLVEWRVDQHTGIDGTAMRMGTIMRLPPELAAKALKKARGG